MKSLKSRALTLIELVVVMLILVALAGVLVPQFNGVLTQAHVAATTTNVPGIEAAVRSRALLRSGDIGDNFDSLIVGSGGSATVAPYMPGVTFWEPYTLMPEDRAALVDLGVRNLVPANAAPAPPATIDATFGSHTLAPAVPTEVCAMATGGGEDVSMLASFNMTPVAGARYVALGIGSQCTLVGGGENAAMSEAPVHFGDTTGSRSNVAYTRYFLIVEIQNDGMGNAQARFVGVAAPHENGLERNEAHLREFYNQ